MDHGTYKMTGENADQEAGLNATDIEMDEETAAKEKLTSSDPTKIKYTNSAPNSGADYRMGKNGEAKVNIESVNTNVGMCKDELMKYANEPFWVRLRTALFVLFWVTWVAMLVGSVVIVLLAPRCAPPPTLDWWQDTVVYQVYVKSFRDSDKDGIGDLNGIRENLDYFQLIGVDTLLLSPIYPYVQNGDDYDIIHFEDVDRRYGSLEDFQKLQESMKAKGMKLILDFVPNHSNKEHKWFQDSEKGVEQYKDYYVWADPKKGGGPPNNWKSVYGGSAWEFSPQRNQYYLHQYRKDQPDLNLRNPRVREEMQKVLHFWLGKGVDGFRVDGASHLIEHEGLLDEPVVDNTTAGMDDYEYLNHIYTMGQPETFELLSEWRMLLKNYTESTGSYKVLLTELFEGVENSTLYYGNASNPIVDIPFNYELLKLNQASTGHELHRLMSSWVDAMPSGKWPNWVMLSMRDLTLNLFHIKNDFDFVIQKLGHQETSRLATRIGSDQLDGIHMVVLLARGTPITYYGDEIGMEDVSAVMDRKGEKHLASRAPMHWNNSTLAGFTEGNHSWIPFAPDPNINVEVEKADKNSHLSVFRDLIRLRKKPAIKFGTIGFPIVSDTIFSMIRVRKGFPGYLVVLNMGTNSTVLDFSGTSKYLPESAEVELHSAPAGIHPPRLATKQKVKLDHLPIAPKEAAVLSFVPQMS